MAQQNPDRLIPLLEDLVERVRSFNNRISYTIDDASRIQHTAADQTSQAGLDVAQHSTLSENDQRDVVYWQHEVATFIQRINDLLVRISGTTQQLQRILTASERSLSYWNNELDSARLWLQRANARLARAIHELEIASRNLRQAESALSSAQSALSSCRNSYRTDSQGRRITPNCGNQEWAVTQARNRVHDMERMVRLAQEEKAAAEEEVRQAQARVNACEVSVHYANQAVQQSRVSLQTIDLAQTNAQSSLEEANAASRQIELAHERNQQQLQLVTENEHHIQMARQTDEQARHRHIEASQLSYEIQYYANAASDEVDRRTDALREFASDTNNV